MDVLQLVEVAIRGGGAALCLFVSALLVLRRANTVASISGAMFGLGAALYIATSMEAVHAMLGSAHLPVKFFGMVSPGFFWLFVVALLDDRFRLRAWHVAPPLALAAIFPLCCLQPESPAQQIASTIRVVFVLALMAHTLLVARRSLNNDLVESRRRLSATLSWVVPLLSLTIAVIEVYEKVASKAVSAEPFLAVLLLAVSGAFAAAILSVSPALFESENAKTPLPNETGMTAADRIEIGRLRDLMEDSAYLQQGLTIGELAKQVGIPEHRLRRLVNNHLGYRNFSAFINDYRIREAQRRLADPALAREQITGLAFDLGFASLAPFNRAFRERLGMSPSEFREKMLETAAMMPAAPANG